MKEELTTELIGYAGAFLTTISFLPQAIKTIKTKDTSGISLLMYSLFLIGVLFWGAYGLILWSMPMIMANIVTIIFAGTVWVYKVKDSVKKY